ncbi:MAG TPA: lipid II flippase MurJ [Acidimicrobiia bacterium]|nr:lipid II flippase MurJ [Acidimicrobiia bacterium]
MWFQVPRRTGAAPDRDRSDALTEPDAADRSSSYRPEPPEAADELGIGQETAASFGVAGWTLFSRFTGLLRVAVAGAILGPTFFANIFQATNTIPNLTYNLMAGSLLTELIIPVLVAELDHRGIEETRKLLRQLVGVVLAGFAAAALAVSAASPIIVHLLTLGVHGHVQSGRAHTECWVLLFLVLPQIGLYGIIAVATAAQNARGRFALAAAAPALENIGLITTLMLVSRWFGRDTSHVSTGYLLFLGSGATLAVAVHAALQCFGAARCGLPLWPSFKWRNPAVRAVARRMLPAAGTATLDSGWLFIIIVAAGTVPGGVVAIQIGINFYYMPIALSAKSVGTVLLPRLSREALHNKMAAFRNTYDRGVSWAWFVAVPASFTLLVSAKPIAQALAFGQMRRGDGVALLSASIGTLGLALIGATMYEFAKQTCYARHDVRAPLIACATMVALLLAGAPIAAVMLSGPAVLVGLGLLVALGEVARSVITDRAARRGTPRQRGSRAQSLGRHIAAAAVTIGPASLVGRVVQGEIGGHIGALVGVVLGVSVGLVAYVAVQAVIHAPELPPGLRFGAARAASAAAVEHDGPVHENEGAT